MFRLSQIEKATTKHFDTRVFVTYEIRAEGHDACRLTEILNLKLFALLPGVCTVQPFSLAEWELELTSGLVVICLPAEHPIILAHKGRVSRQDHPMVKET